MSKGGFSFPNNPIYEISIYPAGTTSYYLEENLYSNGEHYMKMVNAQGIISTIEGIGMMGIQKYPQENNQINFKSTEPVLRQQQNQIDLLLCLL